MVYMSFSRVCTYMSNCLLYLDDKYIGGGSTSFIL